MLPLGHSSAGFLISQLKKPKPNFKEIIFLVFCANIFDLDLIYLFLNQKPLFIHHRLPSHTPFFGVFYFLILYLIFKKILSKKIFIMGVVSSLSHLFLDNLTYILYPNISSNNISWFYPFFDPQNNINIGLLNQKGNQYTTELSSVIPYYLNQKPALMYIEIILLILSAIIYYIRYVKKSKKIFS